MKLDRRSSALLAAGVGGTALLAYWLYRREMARRFAKGALFAQYEEALTVSPGQLRALRDDFVKEARAGLEGKPSSLLMMPSMVDVLPTGKESGEFLAIDIGGTNFRVVYVRLSSEDGQVAQVEMDDYPIPAAFFTCHVDDLFELLASTALTFLAKLGRTSAEDFPPCGFCFSFPMEQTALGAGRTLRKTKRFDNEGFVGVDPAQALTGAFQRLGAKVSVPVLLNDAVGTLAGGRYEDQSVLLGLILGTGTNASYVERTSSIHTIPQGAALNSEEMVVNTEWGDFNSPHLPRLQVDRDLDAATPNPGQQLLEKLMSGMYLGEIARRILLHLAEEGDLFRGEVPQSLREPWSLGTPLLSQIDEDVTPDLSTAAGLLEEKLRISPQECDLFARQRVQSVCRLVAKRSAALAAASLAGLLSLTGRDGVGRPMTPVTAAVDGGVFEHYVNYRQYVAHSLCDVMGKEAAEQVTLRQIRDASSMGAAFLAAAAHSLPQLTLPDPPDLGALEKAADLLGGLSTARDGKV